jgi:hypothetical protein
MPMGVDRMFQSMTSVLVRVGVVGDACMLPLTSCGKGDLLLEKPGEDDRIIEVRLTAAPVNRPGR